MTSRWDAVARVTFECAGRRAAGAERWTLTGLAFARHQQGDSRPVCKGGRDYCRMMTDCSWKCG